MLGAADESLRADVGQLYANERVRTTTVEQRLTAMATRTAGAAEQMRNEMVVLLGAELAKHADATRARLGEAESRMAQMTQDNAAVRTQVGEQATANAQLRDEVAKLRVEAAKKADAARAHLDEAERRVTQLAADNAALRARADALEGANAQLRGEVAKVRSEAAEFRGAADRRLSSSICPTTRSPTRATPQSSGRSLPIPR